MQNVSLLFVLQSIPFNPVNHRRSVGYPVWQCFSKVARNIPPDGDQLTIQQLASLEHPAHQKTNLTKLCISPSNIFDSY